MHTCIFLLNVVIFLACHHFWSLDWVWIMYFMAICCFFIIYCLIYQNYFFPFRRHFPFYWHLYCLISLSFTVWSHSFSFLFPFYSNHVILHSKTYKLQLTTKLLWFYPTCKLMLMHESHIYPHMHVYRMFYVILIITSSCLVFSTCVT